jgi:biotin carboxylase
MAKPVSVVLGGTAAHRDLILALQRRGYEAVLVDYLPNPPAAAVADRHIQASTLDRDAVLKIAREVRASLVISGCVDQANVTACWVAEQLGLTAPYSYKTALRVTDKEQMKHGLVRAGVATAAHRIVTKDDIDAFEPPRLPQVVKPCDCNGSKGVVVVHTLAEMQVALVEACRLSRSRRAVVEDFNAGFEITAYALARDDKVAIIYVKRKLSPQDFGLSSLQSFVSFGPEPLTDAVEKALVLACQGIAHEFALSNTPMLIQAHVDGTKVNIIEFAPRVGGGLAFEEIRLLTGCNLIEAVVDSYLQIPISERAVRLPHKMAAIIHLYGTEGELDHVGFADELAAEGVIHGLYMHKTPGMSMSCQDFASRNRVAGVIITGDSCDELRHKTALVMQRLRVVSKSGQDVLFRDWEWSAC